MEQCSMIIKIDCRYFSPAQLVAYGVLDSFSLEEIAEKLEVDIRTVREWISQGELRAVNVSRNKRGRKPRLRVMEDDMTVFVEKRSTNPPPKPVRRRHLPPVEQFV